MYISIAHLFTRTVFIQIGESAGFRVFQTAPSSSIREITSSLSTLPFILDDRICLFRRDNILTLFHFDSGVRVEVTVIDIGGGDNYFMNFGVFIPASYMHLTKGFLGNFDGNKNVELFTRSGMPVNIADSADILNNMQSCK